MYPRGMVLMVSSGSMSLETDATIACLEWFIDTARNKPSRWRLMIPPDCLEALETQALSRVDGDVERYTGHCVNVILRKAANTILLVC